MIQQLLAILDELDPPLRTRKLSNSEVLDSVLMLLKTGIAWKDLKLLGVSSSAVYKRYSQWVRRGVIAEAWRRLLAVYSEFRINSDPAWFKELFIDSTMIKNVAGRDCVGCNPTDRRRLGTKLSVICDTARIPVSAAYFPANQNDVRTIQQTVEGIQCKIRKDDRYRTILIGDKGYVSRGEAELLKPKRIRLLTEPRKNQHNQKRCSKDKAALKKRIVIEHLFCRLDKFKRLVMRRDQSVSLFEAMHQLAFCMLIVTEMSRNKSD